MKKTFDEIITERYPHRQNNLYALDYEVTALMQYVREQTLKECADKAKILFHDGRTKENRSISQFNTNANNIKLDKDSILSLDKNTIDV